MKILTIISTALLLNVYMAAAGTPLIGVDKSRIESIALKSITKQYADIKPDNLAFDGIEYSMTASGSETINVTYKLPALTKTEVKRMGNQTNQVISLHTVVVRLSNDGEVMNVSKGNQTSFLPVTK